MTYPKLLLPVGLAVVLLSTPSLASAEGQGHRRAVPRGSVRAVRPPVARVAPYRHYRPYSYYRPYYRSGLGLGFYYGYPGFYGPYAWGYPAWGYAPYAYGAYGFAPYAYGIAPYGYVGRRYGGVRIDLPQRDAEVFVDGYFAGIVDDFDGAMQHLNLEPGPHRIEVRAAGFEPISFDVNVEPGRSITYRGSMIPERP